jgi:hypothetical protein
LVLRKLTTDFTSRNVRVLHFTGSGLQPTADINAASVELLQFLVAAGLTADRRFYAR